MEIFLKHYPLLLIIIIIIIILLFHRSTQKFHNLMLQYFKLIANNTAIILINKFINKYNLYFFYIFLQKNIVNLLDVLHPNYPYFKTRI